MKKSYIYWSAYSLIGVASVVFILVLIWSSLPLNYYEENTGNEESISSSVKMQLFLFANCFNCTLVHNFERKVIFNTSDEISCNQIVSLFMDETKLSWNQSSSSLLFVGDRMKNVLIFCTVIFLYFKTSYMDDNLDNEHNLTVHLQAIYQLDDQQCIPRLLCELASTRNKNLLSPQEKSVLKLFSGSGLNITEESLQVKYKSAIRIGVKNGNSYVCAVKYASCPLNRRELMMIFNIISTPSGELN